MRDEIYDLVEDGAAGINEYFRRQLFRWLANVSVNLNNYGKNCAPCGVDPNTVTFPLPEDIKKDLGVLRNWNLNYDRESNWDDDVTIDNYDDSDDDDSDDDDDEDNDGDEDTVDGKKDPHELFVDLLASRVDAQIEPFDMTIDGAVPWIELEKDVIKTDTHDEQSNAIFNKRAKRKLLSAKQMQQKRAELNERYVCLYGEPNASKNMFEDLATNLEAAWKEFDALLVKDA